ncbi:hypothetical protein AAFH68_37030 [Flavobacterium sp. CGRL1]
MMQLKYNEVLLGEADNIQDLTINFIYNKIGLFIEKPDFFYNDLIPDTLRGFHELMSSFKDDNDNLNKFIKYINYRISAEFDSHKINLFKRIESCNDQIFNVVLLNILLELIEDSNDEIQTFYLKVRNPYNLSIPDIILCFDYIYEKLELNDDVSKRFLNYLKIYASLRSLQFSPLLKRNFLKGGLVNDDLELFPKLQTEVQRRDYFEIDLKSVYSDANDIQKIWISSFLPIVGKYDPDFRLTEEKIYDRKKRISSYENASFSPLYPIISVFTFELKSVDEILYDEEANDLIKSCVVWNKKNNELKKLFTNIQFVAEFLSKLNSFATSYRTPHVSYSITISEYLFKGIPAVLKSLKRKYNFLSHIDDNSITTNPIFQYWKDNEKDCLDILEKIYKNRNSNLTYSKTAIETAILVLDKYSKYFDRTIKNTSSQGTKQAMNFLVKLFENEVDIFRDLKKYRKQMDRQFNNGLNNIHNLLLRIANGQSS